jgi:hypothetical protein
MLKFLFNFIVFAALYLTSYALDLSLWGIAALIGWYLFGWVEGYVTLDYRSNYRR